MSEEQLFYVVRKENEFGGLEFWISRIEDVGPGQDYYTQRLNLGEAEALIDKEMNAEVLRQRQKLIEEMKPHLIEAVSTGEFIGAEIRATMVCCALLKDPEDLFPNLSANLVYYDGERLWEEGESYTQSRKDDYAKPVKILAYKISDARKITDHGIYAQLVGVVAW